MSENEQWANLFNGEHEQQLTWWSKDKERSRSGCAVSPQLVKRCGFITNAKFVNIRAAARRLLS
jgi:hypothetical protein